MREKKYHIYLTAEEQSRVIQSLMFTPKAPVLQFMI